MPITWDILEDGVVIRITFSDPWKTAEMLPAFDADQAHRDKFQKQHPDRKVHLIVDFSQAKIAADGALIVRKSPSLTHPTSGSTVIVGANPLLKSLANAAFRLTHYERAVFVKTLDEAFDHIHNLESATTR